MPTPIENTLTIILSPENKMRDKTPYVYDIPESNLCWLHNCGSASKSTLGWLKKDYGDMRKMTSEEIEANEVEVKIYFATAYNKDSLNSGAKNWKQASVRSFFAEEELLIGKDFWNFICDSDKGWEVIMGEYKKNSPIIKQTLSEVINSF